MPVPAGIVLGLGILTIAAASFTPDKKKKEVKEEKKKEPKEEKQNIIIHNHYQQGMKLNENIDATPDTGSNTSDIESKEDDSAGENEQEAKQQGKSNASGINIPSERDKDQEEV